MKGKGFLSLTILFNLTLAGYLSGLVFYSGIQTTPISELKSSILNLKSSIVTPQSSISGIIVNHHLLAASLIDEAFEKVKSDEPMKVILLSPNHFNAGVRAIQTSGAELQTPEGEFPVDLEISKRLIESGQLGSEVGSFKGEHGIYNILPYVKKYLPKATITPVIIKDGTSDEKIDVLAQTIHKAVPGALIIASLDFSHYLTSTAAQFHDQKSLQVIRGFDFDSIKNVEIDSKPVLRLMLKLMTLDQAKDFTLLQNTNSAEFSKTLNLLETTSYVTGYFEPGQSSVVSGIHSVNILAVGDLMLDRYIRTVINDKGFDYLFEPVARLFDGTDLNVANLEGCFTDFTSIPEEENSNLHFTFDPKLILNLKSYNFNLVNLANNHSANFGAEGLAHCQKYLDDGKLEYFGDPFNKDQVSLIKEIRGRKIAFVGFHQFYKSELSAQSIINEIRRIQTISDFIIVYPHWGTEYEAGFTGQQQKWAHDFIDAGADLIIGTHPHVIEPIELYKNKIIFYSLGNFIFDQTWDPSVRNGLAVGLTISDNNLQMYLLPMEMRDWQLHLLEPKNSDIVLNKLADDSQVSEDFKQSIKKGIINILLK